MESAAAPAAVDAAPSVAPAAVSLPSFEFSDGAKEVVTASDPNAIYKGLVEHTLRSHWNRPEDMADDSFVAEVRLTVDAGGGVTGYQWLNGSGDKRWDDSVKAALAATKAISRQPPKGFPDSFVVKFDVESIEGGEPLQLSLR
jgi:TonB family protein